MKTFNPEKHHRRSIRLRNYDYRKNGAYFITLVTKNREMIFGNVLEGEMLLSEFGNIANSEWLKNEDIREEITLDQHVIMPNHLHAIIFIQGNTDVVRPYT